MTLDTVICSLTEKIHTPLRGQRKFRGEGGPKGGNFQGGEVTSQVFFFFPGLQVRLMSKLSVILLLLSVSNQKLLF